VRERLKNAAGQRRSGIDHASVELDKIGAGADFLQRGIRAIDVADADDRHVPAEQPAHSGKHRGRALEQRLAGEPARLAGGSRAATTVSLLRVPRKSSL